MSQKRLKKRDWRWFFRTLANLRVISVSKDYIQNHYEFANNSNFWSNNTNQTWGFQSEHQIVCVVSMNPWEFLPNPPTVGKLGSVTYCCWVFCSTVGLTIKVGYLWLLQLPVRFVWKIMGVGYLAIHWSITNHWLNFHQKKIPFIICGAPSCLADKEETRPRESH